MRHHRRAPGQAAAGLLVILAALLAACSSSIPAPVIRDAAPVPERVERGVTSMESEIGGLNEEAMDRAFASLEVQRCLTEGSSRLSAIGGFDSSSVRVVATNVAGRLVADTTVLVTYETPGALRSSLWRHDGSAWRVLFHQGTPTPD